MDAVGRRGPATETDTGRACPYCRFPLKEGVDVVQCAFCSSSHHADCWDDNTGCAVVACAGGPKAAGAAAPPPSRAVPPPPVQPSQRLKVDLGPPGGAPPPPPPPPPPRKPPGPSPAALAAQRAGELLGRLRAGVKTPLLVYTLVAAVIGTVVVFAAGVAVALVFPENGTYEFAWLGDGVGTIREALRYSVGFLQAGFNSFGVARPSPMPLLFVAFPLFGCALGAYLQMGRTTGLKRHQRLAWGALVGVPFAVVMRILAAGMGHDLTAKSSQTFWLALVWGSIGGLAGARWALRGELASESSGVLPGAVTRVVHAAGTAVKPLAVLVGVLGIIGAAVWVVQDVRNIPSASHASEGSAPPKSSAVIQDILYVGEHGVRLTELGSGTRFVYRYGNRGTGYPIPVKHTEKIDHRTGDADSSGFGFRIFNYSHALKPYVFVPVLIGLLGGLAFFALFAGFSTARAAGATDVRQGAWWGASVGVIWAAAMSALEALARIESPFDPNGFASGDSVFLTFLIAGSALGALGGFLALRNAPALAPAPTDPIAEGAQ